MTIAQVLAGEAKRWESTGDTRIALTSAAYVFLAGFLQDTPEIWFARKAGQRAEQVVWLQSAAEWAKVRGE